MVNRPTVTKKGKPRRKSQSPSPSVKNDNDEQTNTTGTDTDDEEDDIDIDRYEKKGSHQKRPRSNDTSKNMTDDDEDRDSSAGSTKKRSIKLKNSSKSIGNLASSSSKQMLHTIMVVLVILPIIGGLVYNQMSKSNSEDGDWRSKVDPHDVLSHHQQSIVRASMKSIMDRSTFHEGVSTLLILSSEEETAAKLARCLLRLINTQTHKAQIPTEIDLRSHRGGKVQLDSNLRSLLSPGGTIRAVLLRHIDDNSSTDAFERARLLFAYCDGENPVIPHRLIIMTASSAITSENDLRETLKSRWSSEHDFVDALMSRISGHTLFVGKDQKSIC